LAGRDERNSTFKLREQLSRAPPKPTPEQFVADSPLEETVSSEPVSEDQFPVSWENTGKSSILASYIRISRRKHVQDQCLTGRIPYAVEQGINCAPAGYLIRSSAKLCTGSGKIERFGPSLNLRTTDI
jgi:hypothetical protein